MKAETPTILTLAAFAMAAAIVAAPTLGAISMGLRPPTPELGGMMIALPPSSAEAPLHGLSPAILIVLMVLALRLHPTMRISAQVAEARRFVGGRFWRESEARSMESVA